MGPKVNAKAEAANAKKAAAQQEKDALTKRQQEKDEEIAWSVGGNARAENRKKEADTKADEQLRKKQEMAALLAAEEALVAGTVFTGKKTKKKGKDDIDKLNEVLAAKPQTKAEKLAEEKKKTAEIKKQKEEEARAKREEDKRKRDADAQKAGIVLDHGDSLLVENTNKLDSGIVEVSGIENALSALSTDPADDAHPEKRQKALHKAYVDKMMPIVKQDYPGLRLTQYQEKIFDLWKTSPENPRYVALLKAKEEQRNATL